MQKYKAELEANIDLADNNSCTFIVSKANLRNSVLENLPKTISTVQSVEELIGQNQPDLALVVAILVSTGWNLNDDIFLPDEVWKARFTPSHKPINDNHDADKILGHIITSRVLDKSGNEINMADNDNYPDEFDIEVAGVLYRSFPQLADRINEIIDKAQTGEIFVSMECWFQDFGYGIIDSNTNETKLIERNEQTAFLTKHLKIYGGSGEYKGYKIGRILKDMIFGAQGFVDVPANPDSIIKVAAKKLNDSKIFVTAKLNDLVEGGVSDVDQEQIIADLTTKLEEAKSALADRDKEIAELKGTISDFESKDFDGQIIVLNQKIGELTETSQKLEGEKDELQNQLDIVKAEADKTKAELEEIRKNEVANDRFSKLTEVKVIENKETTLAELRNMTDETFELVLKYAGEKEKDVAKEDEDAKASLDNAEEEDEPDFKVVNNEEGPEQDKWISTATGLCGGKINDEGGE